MKTSNEHLQEHLNKWVVSIKSALDEESGSQERMVGYYYFLYVKNFNK